MGTIRAVAGSLNWYSEVLQSGRIFDLGGSIGGMARPLANHYEDNCMAIRFGGSKC